MKFTKIRKWATAKGFEVKDVVAYTTKPVIRVLINDDLYFEIDERESTIYHSIHGVRGNPKGLYLSTEGKGRRGYAFHKTSQSSAIEDMENVIKRGW